jgi:hypothetical protein
MNMDNWWEKTETLQDLGEKPVSLTISRLRIP